jgi:hypothetical protein
MNETIMNEYLIDGPYPIRCAYESAPESARYRSTLHTAFYRPIVATGNRLSIPEGPRDDAPCAPSRAPGRPQDLRPWRTYHTRSEETVYEEVPNWTTMTRGGAMTGHQHTRDGSLRPQHRAQRPTGFTHDHAAKQPTRRRGVHGC